MTVTISAYIFNVLTAITAMFQLALAMGMPWGELTWGGKFPGQLPDSMRAAAVISAILLLAFALVVSVRAGLLLPRWELSSRKVIWVVVAYCMIGVFANAVTPSPWERILWLPVLTVLLVCSVRVAVR